MVSNTSRAILCLRWSSVDSFISGAGGLRFNCQVSQIEHSVANGSPPLRHFIKKSCVAERNDAEIGRQRGTLRLGVIQ